MLTPSILLSMAAHDAIHKQVATFVKENMSKCSMPSIDSTYMTNLIEDKTNELVITALQKCREEMEKFSQNKDFKCGKAIDVVLCSIKSSEKITAFFVSVLSKNISFLSLLRGVTTDSFRISSRRCNNNSMLSLNCDSFNLLFGDSSCGHQEIYATWNGTSSFWTNTSPKRDLQGDVSKLWKSALEKKCTDVEISVGVVPTIFHAHKTILMINSQYFEAMFSSGMKESQPSDLNKTVIKIEECSAAIFEKVLKSLYFEIPEVESLDSKATYSLLQAAERFGAKELKEVCVRSIEQGVITNQGIINCAWDDEGFALLFELAQSSNIKKFMEICTWSAEQRPVDMARLESLIETITDVDAVESCILDLPGFPKVKELLLKKERAFRREALDKNK